jgi:hypothetical protein
VVEAWLDHVSRNNSYIGYGSCFGITRVTVSEPQANYCHITDGGMEYWYEWVIMIKNEGSDSFYHTGYCIDASTGQILSTMFTP